MMSSKREDFFCVLTKKPQRSFAWPGPKWLLLQKCTPLFLSTPAEYVLPSPGEVWERLLLLPVAPIVPAGLQNGSVTVPYLDFNLMAFLFISYSCTVSGRAKLLSGELRMKWSKCKREREEQPVGRAGALHGTMGTVRLQQDIVATGTAATSSW